MALCRRMRGFQSLGSERARNAAVAVLVVLAGVWLWARFVALNDSPPGFWMDEAWDAAHALCLSQTGHDADGRSWPLFSNALGGGSLPITWTFFDVFWTRAFGTTRGAFRAAAGFWNVITCMALFGFARAVRPLPVTWEPTLPSDAALARNFPWLVVLAALLSPWSYQFSRIAWEGPLAPAWLSISLWSLARLWRSPRRAWWAWAALGGVAAGL